MLISTKGRYALRVMIDLAENQGSDYVPLRAIAERQAISEKYLEAILKSLVKHRLLTGLRGKGGGYRLTKDAKEYTVFSILEAAEEALCPVACLDKDAPACPRKEKCRTIGFWMGLNDVVYQYLTGVTLYDLALQDTMEQEQKGSEL